MKTWAVVSARSSGLLATRKKFAGPLLKIDPWAVTRSSTIRSTCMLRPERLAEPEIERQHSLGAQLFGIDAQDITPLECPVIDVLGAVEQAVDQLGTLAGIGVGDEIFDLVRASEWFRSHRASPGGEIRNPSTGRGNQSELAPLGGGLGIHDVLGREIKRLFACERDSQPRHGRMALVTDHDVGLAAADCPGQARWA